MNIFKKRPLSLILCIMLGGFSLFAESDASLRIIFLGVAVFAFFLTFIKGFIVKNKKTLTRICISAFAISIAFSGLWSFTFYPTEYIDKEHKITATVIDVKECRGYTYLTVKTSNIGENNASYKVACYVYDVEQNIELGDVIECRGKLLSTSAETNNEDKLYSTKNGISAVIEDVKNFKVIGHKNLWLTSTLQNIRNGICQTLISRTNASAGGFISALLIGVRDNLDKDTALSFRRLGISHILALSGMHLSIITLGLDKLLSLIRIKKRGRIVITVAFTLLYMAIAGFTPSITRSGIMLIFYYLLFLLARSRDTFTSLCVAVFLIVLITPHAIFDISLWLSALATLGIITAPRLNIYKEGLSRKRKILIHLLNVYLSSMFAVGATLLVTVLTFERISPLSIIATLVFTPIITGFMYAGILLLILGGIIPLGAPMKAFADFIKELAEITSRPSLVYTSATFPAVITACILFSAVLLAFLILNIKRKRTALAILSAMFISVFLISGLSSNAVLRKDSTRYLRADADDCILIKDNSAVYLIATEALGREYAYSLCNTLSTDRLTKLDELVLTSYSNSFGTSIEAIIGTFKTETVRLPYPENSRELSLATELAELLSLYGTDMRFYSVGDDLKLENYGYKLLFRTELGNANSGAVFTLTSVSLTTTYFTGGAYDLCDYKTLSHAAKSDTVIIGYADGSFDLVLPNIDTLVITREDAIAPSLFDYYCSKGIEIICVNTEYDIEKGRD